jgi:hypothetical protein
VKYFQNGISLQRRSAAAATPKSKATRRLTISLPPAVALDFQKQAEKKGVSQADLAATLLDAITRNNLYDALIDPDSEPKGHKPSRVSRRSKKRSD